MTTVDRDEEHLKLLSILHYVWGGLAMCGVCFGALYFVLGGFLLGLAAQGQGDVPPAALGGLFSALGAGITLMAATVGGLNILVGRSLAQKRRYTLCLVMSGINCLSIPFGTALGVFTIMVLQRPGVQQRFGRSSQT